MMGTNKERNVLMALGYIQRWGEVGTKTETKRDNSENGKTFAIGKCSGRSTLVHCTRISTFLWVWKLYSFKD